MHWIQKWFGGRKQTAKRVFADDFIVTTDPTQISFIPLDQLQQELRATGAGTLKGYCSVCCRPAHFTLSEEFRYAVRNGGFVNWRDDVVCVQCGFNARLRATIAVLDWLQQPITRKEIYITEAITPLYRYLSRRGLPLLGSEFLNVDRCPGQCYLHQGRKVRHEDLTALTFASAHFDMVLSFDVLEHIDNYRQALREIARVLRPHGVCLLTTPLNPFLAKTVTRAHVAADGTINHLLEPVYHGDPVHGAGVLCFHDFGIDLLDTLHQSGFSTVECIVAQSETACYLGHFNLFLLARK